MPSSIASLVGKIREEAIVLGEGLPGDVISALADVVRIANSFHSNLIEGHHADPVAISAALEGDDSVSAFAREAASHVLVQWEIEALALAGSLPIPTSPDFISWAHRRLYEGFPVEFGSVAGPMGERLPIIPGAFRSDGDPDVVVGRHQPPSSPRVHAFMDHFARRYQGVSVGSLGRVVAVAAAHHRFNYIHPFPDGNGRVSRLMSHAMALRAGIGGNGLWSVSRGLSVGINEMSEYKRHMDHADHPRMGDRDGRGNLSLKALTTFCEWFLSTILAQIRFSKNLFSVDALDARYGELAVKAVSDVRAANVVSALLKGARVDPGPELVEKLVWAGFLSSSHEGHQLRFRAAHHGAIFPGLMSAQ